MLERNRGGNIESRLPLLSFHVESCLRRLRGKGRCRPLNKSRANEWDTKGINVNALAPGYMATDNTFALRTIAVGLTGQILDRFLRRVGVSRMM